MARCTPACNPLEIACFCLAWSRQSGKPVTAEAGGGPPTEDDGLAGVTVPLAEVGRRHQAALACLQAGFPVAVHASVTGGLAPIEIRRREASAHR